MRTDQSEPSNYFFKPILLAAILLCCAFTYSTSEDTFASDKSIIAMTYNIKFDIPEDEDYNWEERKSMISQTISSNTPDVMGVQEAYYNQVKWLAEELEIYDWYAIGGDDGEFRGEHCAIFYNKSKYVLLDSGTFWLSDSENQPGSVSWDSVEPSVMTWVKLKMNINGDELYVFNTRLGETEMSRFEGSKLLIRKIKGLAHGTSFILTGDFNSEPDHKSIQLITESCKEAKQNCFINASEIDYTSIEVEHGKKIFKRQDYVFFSNHFPVNSYEVVDNTFNNRYPSDHLPVLCRLRLP